MMLLSAKHFSVNIVYLCTGLYKKVIIRWWWCGGGVVYLTDYRTTPGCSTLFNSGLLQVMKGRFDYKNSLSGIF